ncbi:MAG: 2,3-bisphosphoglycerate-independent phosphoglycerate mutase [Gammaproteobacteria bacterium]|nr:2,3-bisphosphoglycerate-independent phosphoglycerate mutase [Gammaproteobacteria bacterium]
MNDAQKQPALLLILDGWGYREETDHNAIHAANTPVWDRLWSDQQHTLVRTSGLAVGLPEGQMGNSEVGHMNLGAGRVVYQSLTRIDKAIEDGDFYNNPTLCQAIDKAVDNDRAVHIFGLLSPGGIHSHEAQIFAAIELAHKRGAGKIYLHAFLDGRDTPPRSALASLQKANAVMQGKGDSRIASIAGRFFAMDRDQRWERVQPTYDMLTLGKAPFQSSSAEAALEAAYQRDEDDEFVQPTVISDEQHPPVALADEDCVIFMNFRADRARQLTRAFVNDDFDGFKRLARPALADFITLTEYAADIDTPCAFPSEELKNVLGEYLASEGKTQLRIAETEKYAHVTFFFNGGREQPFDLEERVLVPSPKVKTYDLQPEMSALEVTDKLVDAIKSRRFDAIICNYANGDMVGHTGDFDAAVKAVETVDQCLGRIVEAIQAVDGDLLVTADHGNVEQMVDTETGQPLTSHTNGPVPLVYVGSSGLAFDGQGSLCDLAPTLLTLMQLPVPAEMTGRVLLVSPEELARRAAG